MKEITCNLSLKYNYTPSEGLKFRISSANARKTVTVTLTTDANNVTFRPEVAYNNAEKGELLSHPEVLPKEKRASLPVTLKFRREMWGFYIGDNKLASLPVPFSPPAKIAIPRSDSLDESNQQAFVQEVRDFRFTDNFLVPEDQENPLPAWKKLEGKWELHTAVDNAVSRGDIRRSASKKPKPARSPNFYSLKGSGKSAIIVTGRHFYDYYTYRAAIQATPGETGLLFYLRDRNNYYGLTLTKNQEDTSRYGDLRLWERKKGARINLAHQRIAAPEKQWLRLKVKLYQGRITCSVDRTEIFDQKAVLPAGGRFGLFANTESGARFDDVAARTNSDLYLKNASRLRRYTLRTDGAIFRAKKTLGLFGGEKKQLSWPLQVGSEKKPQRLILGSEHHEGHVFSARFKPRSDSFRAGILTGWEGPRDVYYRFSCTRKDEREIFRLSRVAGDTTKELESLTLSPSQSTKQDITLTADAHKGNRLRLYRNDKLVLVKRVKSSLKGGSGIYTAPGTKAQVNNMRYRSKRTGIHHNRFEKQRTFVEDEYMRHWSSPEGQWIKDKEHKDWHWYKSDFFGRFTVRLPAIPGTKVHMGIEEGETEGKVALRVSESTLSLYRPDIEGKEKALAKVPFQQLAHQDGNMKKKDSDRRWFSLRYEDHWLRLTSGDKVHMKIALAKPLQGPKMRLNGFTYKQLRRSYVRRYQTKDFLFTDSLHKWVVNGGTWNVVNRFQCQPRWSHMNGQSAKSLAALWSKYRFKGDFCIEMYAGMRHQWYERAGDLNLTIMNDRMSPSSGYTVTCTGWDRDHSQRLTKIYKNGKVIASSDKYLVPRSRQGKQRRGYNPLIPEDRDLHGAWYYIKLRRINDTLKYYFDNELVFEVEDPSPIKAGSMGIWTFMNSMMVARVKVAAEGIESKRPAFPPPAKGDGEELFAPAIDGENRPLNTMRPSKWYPDTPVGRGQLQWRSNDRGDNIGIFRNFLGSGSIQTAYKSPPREYKELAGWKVWVKRKPKTQFNIHYTIGVPNNDGTFVRKKHFFHRINGTDFSKGAHKQFGHTPLPASKGSGSDWYQKGKWYPVTIWLPGKKQVAGIGSRANLHVKFQGFGNLQPSYILQGLQVNRPNSGYAFRGFHPIFYNKSIPETIATQGKIDRYTMKLKGKHTSQSRSFDTLKELRERLRTHNSSGLNQGYLGIQSGDKNVRVPFSWIKLPDKLDVTCRWRETTPPAIEFQNRADYADRRFLNAEVKIAGLKASSQIRSVTTLNALLPRHKTFQKDRSETFQARLHTETGTKNFSLSLKERKRNAPPVLKGIQGPMPLVTTFENRNTSDMVHAQPKIVKLKYDNNLDTTYLRVNNMGKQRRLHTAFPVDWNVAKYPLVKFRYKAGPMGRISVGVKNDVPLKFSENYSDANDVRLRNEAVLNNKWHTWQGFASDGFTRHNLSERTYTTNRLTFRSFHGHDQTGLYTDFNLDNVVIGPAVNSGKQLKCTPRYFDHDGIKHVSWRISNRSVPSSNAEHKTSSEWQRIPRGQSLEPALQSFAEGIYYLQLKATDKQEKTSSVTAIPFVLDREKPEISHSFVDSDQPETNGSLLRLKCQSGGGAPLDLTKLRCKWNDEPGKLSPEFSSIIHKREADILLLNYAHIFKKQLNKTKDGQTHHIRISGLQDGAGNRAAPLKIPHTLDHASDKTPPTLLALGLADNNFWHPAWESPLNKGNGFQGRRINTRLIRKKSGKAFLRATPRHPKARLRHKFHPPWKPVDHSLLAFRIRRTSLNKEARLFLRLQSDNKDLYIALNDTKDEKHVALPSPIEWEEGKWHSCIINIKEKLKKRARERFKEKGAQSKKEIKKRTKAFMASYEIKSLFLYVRDSQKKHPVDLRSIHIFSPWSKTTNVGINAFDASGIKDLKLNSGAQTKTTENMQISPGKYLKQQPSAEWLEVFVRDKPGNRSEPLYIPLQPAREN